MAARDRERERESEACLRFLSRLWGEVGGNPQKDKDVP